jgi:hypothetical protein
MKKIFLIISTVALFVSCEKELDQVPISAATTATFYTQPNDFIQASNAIYNDLKAWPDRQLKSLRNKV